MFKILNTVNNQLLAEQAILASSFSQKLLGLMGKAQLLENEALILPQCKIVHSFFMKFPIDLIFCDQENKIVLLQENFKPWKISKFSLLTNYIIELPAGKIKATECSLGNYLKLSPL